MKSTEMNTTMSNEELRNKMVNAIKEDKPEEFTDAVSAMAEQKITNLYNELKDVKDEEILASRGVFMPTSEEKKFYDRLFKDAVGNNPTTAGEIMIPKTVVQRVFEDMRDAEDSILGDLDFVNTTGLSEWLVSISEKPVAAWGDLCDPITKELKVGFKVVQTLVNKLSAYVPYCLSLLDLGYEWQDAYVRQYLSLGLRSTLSIAAISGNGSKAPWGMAYDFDIDNDTGTLKTPVKITELTKKAFASVFAKMTKNPMGYTRTLQNLTLYVDSETYYAYIYANDGELNANGVYIPLLQQLGVKTKVTETGLTKGQAILGLPKRYFMQMGFKGNPNGMITFSDEAFFLEDKRIYKGKLYADGFPKDNNAFVLLDLTGLPNAEPQEDETKAVAQKAKAK